MGLTTGNTRAFWQERYQGDDTPWDRGGVSPALVEWLAEAVIQPPGSVLVPGCGRGHEVIELARRGFHVTAIDVSTRALDELEGRLRAAGLDAELIHADLLEWRPSSPFDVVYEQTCLCALLPRYWPLYEERLYEWLQPNGLLLALFMQSNKHDDPPFHCALPDMQELFEPGRWQWPEEAPRRVPHPRNVYEYAVVLRRRER